MSRIFQACLYISFMRREHFGVTKLMVRYNPLFEHNRQVLERLTAKQVLHAAVQAGNASSVKDLLGEHDLEKDLKQMLRMMQVATHNV